VPKGGSDVDLDPPPGSTTSAVERRAVHHSTNVANFIIASLRCWIVGVTGRASRLLRSDTRRTTGTASSTTATTAATVPTTRRR
jgi:hypothetical protein